MFGECPCSFVAAGARSKSSKYQSKRGRSRASESVSSSIGSNLNRAQSGGGGAGGGGGGPQDLTKVKKAKKGLACHLGSIFLLAIMKRSSCVFLIYPLKPRLGLVAVVCPFPLHVYDRNSPRNISGI
jgi:hypothetical protein